MAELTRMTADEVVSYFLEGEGVDVLRESLLWVCQQLMEAEVSEHVGASRGERAPEATTHRTVRPRVWATRAGEIRTGHPQIRRARTSRASSSRVSDQRRAPAVIKRTSPASRRAR
jgi:transposase-like protein